MGGEDLDDDDGFDSDLVVDGGEEVVLVGVEDRGEELGGGDLEGVEVSIFDEDDEEEGGLVVGLSDLSDLDLDGDTGGLEDDEEEEDDEDDDIPIHFLSDDSFCSLHLEAGLCLPGLQLIHFDIHTGPPTNLAAMII